MLRHKRVAIAGMGGVGGVHLLTLARLGIGAFHIADFDVFDLVNFNRQAGAAVSTLGQPKTQVMAGLAKDINPEVDVKVFSEGVSEHNLSEFLTGIHCRRARFSRRCGAPRYLLRLRKTRHPRHQRCAPGYVGNAPEFLSGQNNVLKNTSSWDNCRNRTRRCTSYWNPRRCSRWNISSTRCGSIWPHIAFPPRQCHACYVPSVTATEALKMRLKRGEARAAPHGLHFDAHRSKPAHILRPGGHRNPLQQLVQALAPRQLAAMQRRAL